MWLRVEDSGINRDILACLVEEAGALEPDAHRILALRRPFEARRPLANGKPGSEHPGEISRSGLAIFRDEMVMRPAAV